VIKGLEHLSYEERLRAGSIQYPRGEKAQRDFIFAERREMVR